MKLQALKTNEALNKAFLKLPLTRSQIEKFKANYKTLLNHYNPSEREEYHKNVISEFLRETYYSPDYYINTKGGYDLVIHNGKDNKSSVGVIIECKSPGNSAEMPVIDNLKSKALYELILYYLRERITNQNLELKHLIITNLFDWFIFDAHEFEKHFANNKSLVKQFRDFEEGRLSGKDTSFFYSSIADPFVNGITEEFKFTYFSLQSFASIIKNDLLSDDHKLIPPFKILSPEHLLKLKFKNDSNSLDRDFYLELLHIIGLEDIKKGGKSLIGRAIPERRNYGSLLESTISTIQSEDLLSQIDNPSKFGTSKDQLLFNISLELVITWINRILFLKLLEGQLVRYNKGDKSFLFLNQSYVPDFDALNKLFFYVLAVPIHERDPRLKEKFCNVPYLNSSLFEATEIERRTIRLSNLDDSNRIPVFKSSILKDNAGKRRSGEITTLHYLFEFLDSYDFSSEGGKKIQEENKTLINASVLGLIFEKINGYKDGSFFTPGYITQYICHKTIIKALIQKFNTIKGWNCQTINEIHNKIEDKYEANHIINSLKICDPAVGSGHFLVSALNEIIAIKSELRILLDREGKTLKDYKFEVINDELIITDIDGEPFEYNIKNHESQRVQEAIFHEKQTIIEGSLFGVDINPNSIKICRLRLWIELLKHSYYRSACSTAELETLPNIDINIKCGNSLISRYPLDSTIEEALRSSKWSIDNYREAVMIYRNSDNKDQKRAMESLISEIKNSFESEFSKKDKRFIRLNRINGELLFLTQQKGLFELDLKQKDIWNKKLLKLVKEQESLEKELADIRNNQVFNNSFEWRFEFPEVLDQEANFIGFDIIIGNPPYMLLQNLNKDEERVLKSEYKTAKYKGDTFGLFIEKAISLTHNKAHISLIVPYVWLSIKQHLELRKLIIDSGLSSVVYLPHKVFESSDLDTTVMFMEKSSRPENIIISESRNNDFNIVRNVTIHDIKNSQLFEINLNRTEIDLSIIKKMETNTLPLDSIYNVSQGYIPYRRSDLIKKYGKEKGDLIVNNRLWHSNRKETEEYIQEIQGKDLTRYGYNESQQYIRYGRHVAGYVDPKFFSNPRVLIMEVTRGTRYKITACFVEPTFCNTPSIINIIHPSNNIDSLLLLLAVINSRLITWYHLKKHSKAIASTSIPKILVNEIRNLPIKNCSDNALCETIIRLSHEIIELRKKGLATYQYDIEVDKLVYQLYGISTDEIEIIEQL